MGILASTGTAETGAYSAKNLALITLGATDIFVFLTRLDLFEKLRSQPALGHLDPYATDQAIFVVPE